METQWWVIEGDDHEKRIIEADSEDGAVEAAAADFSSQYGEPYDTDLLVVLGVFHSEEAAQDSHPDAS